MSEIELGPFHPYDLEQVTEHLKTQGIFFQIREDKEAGEKERARDYPSQKNRTGQVWGQNFYVTLSEQDAKNQAAFFEKLGISIYRSDGSELDGYEPTNLQSAEKKEKVTSRAQLVIFALLIAFVFFKIFKAVRWR